MNTNDKGRGPKDRDDRKKKKDPGVVAMDYIGRRPRTCSEVKAYLAGRDYELQVIEDTVKSLKDMSYIDDANYAQIYLRYSLGKNKGRDRITLELAHKGVSAEDTERGFAMYENEECVDVDEQIYRDALTLAQKMAEGHSVDGKLMGRIGRRLSGLGHSTDTIYKIIGILRSNE